MKYQLDFSAKASTVSPSVTGAYADAIERCSLKRPFQQLS
jgi:hypothetical protein